MTVKREAEIAASGLTPLEFLLGVLRDEQRDWEERLAAAKAAAPYVHPKLASVEMRAQVSHTTQAAEPVTLEDAERAYLELVLTPSSGTNLNQLCVSAV